MSTKIEPLVPLDEIGLAFGNRADAESFCRVAGVELRYDYADRPSVSLPHAYKLAEQRRNTEREYAAAESRRHSERARAVESLREGMTAAFIAARDATLERLAGQPAWAAGDRHAEAVNAGLNAARALWCAAPADVREAVPVVEFVAPDGTFEAIDLGTVMPRATIDAYLHTLAQS